MKPTIRHGIQIPQLPRTLTSDTPAALGEQAELTMTALARCDFS
jgi:hypothetical protein